MKKNFLLCAALLLILGADAQFIKRLGDRAKQKMEQKAGDKVDKGIDDAVDGKKKDKKSKSGTEEKKDDSRSADGQTSNGPTTDETVSSDGNNAGSGAPAPPASLKTYSKYDFVPGEKILVYEDFSQDAIGDFPGKWNTNSSGEIVTLGDKEGKWFKLDKTGIFHPEFITSLPDNFTLEFDLGANNKFSFYSTELNMNIANMTDPGVDYKNWGYYVRWNGKHALNFRIHPNGAGGGKGNSRIVTSVSGSSLIDNTVDVNEFYAPTKNIVHLSFWRQNQRLRVYANSVKIWDLPKAFAAGGVYNSVVFGTSQFHKEEDFYVLSNIRLAVGTPDTRNKLITEGKFVTHGILFDVNSDQIKPESYGAIKDIATVLKENNGVKVKIIGHTDSDGDDKANIDLSKRRAESVKTALVKEFSLDVSRIETDGKGESQPVDKSETPVGKAMNRRVEFIKL